MLKYHFQLIRVSKIRVDLTWFQNKTLNPTHKFIPIFNYNIIRVVSFYTRDSAKVVPTAIFTISCKNYNSPWCYIQVICPPYINRPLKYIFLTDITRSTSACTCSRGKIQWEHCLKQKCKKPHFVSLLSHSAKKTSKD